MTYATPTFIDDLETLPLMPSWVTCKRSETPEDVAFLSGAALSHLHLVLSQAKLPQPLFRARLALRAAEVCVGFAGRLERADALRDEMGLLRPGDTASPAGALALQWQRAVERKFSVKTLVRALPDDLANHIPVWLDVGPQGGPLGQAARVLETVLTDHPREETAALVMADAVLARALGWNHVVPILAAGLKRRDLTASGDDLRVVCHRAVVTQAAEVLRIAHDVTRRAIKMHAVAPKLRAKGAGAAVDMFLSRDALAPSALTGLMSDRAARRLCDRLVSLGAVRELTGRDTFRLYGL